MERFWSKVRILGLDECWEWQRALSTKGYGRFLFQGKNRHTHRIAWLLTRGEIQNGLHVLHKCDNRKCVNPVHLFLGTNTDNMIDMCEKQRAKHRLTWDDILQIRSLEKTMKQKEIGSLFNTRQGYITMILSNKKRTIAPVIPSGS